MNRKKLKTNVIHAGHNVHILKNQVPDEVIEENEKLMRDPTLIDFYTEEEVKE